MLVHDEQDEAVHVDQLDRIVSSLRADQSCTVLRTTGLGHVRILRDATVIGALGDFAERCRENSAVLPPSPPQDKAGERDAVSIQSLADFLRTQVRSTPTEKLARHFRSYVQLMRLDGLEPDASATAKLSECLQHPPTRAELIALIDATALHAAANPYLVEAVRQLAHDGLREWRHRIQTTWSSDAIDVVVYAALLQRLTVTVQQDCRSVRALVTRWRAERTRMRWHQHASRFVLLKLLSIEYPFMKLLKCIQAGSVRSSKLRTTLRINILEAVTFDLFRGHPDNAAAGTVLARHGHRGVAINDAGEAVNVRFPLRRSWADLYTVWNMGFLLHYSNFPWALAKLLIPQVSGYGAEGDGYLYNRVIALYIHVHACVFRSIERSRNPAPPTERRRSVKYRDDRLTKIWGASARRSAEAFASEAAAAPRSSAPITISKNRGHQHVGR